MSLSQFYFASDSTINGGSVDSDTIWLRLPACTSDIDVVGLRFRHRGQVACGLERGADYLDSNRRCTDSKLEVASDEVGDGDALDVAAYHSLQDSKNDDERKVEDRSKLDGHSRDLEFASSYADTTLTIEIMGRNLSLFIARTSSSYYFIQWCLGQKNLCHFDHQFVTI